MDGKSDFCVLFPDGQESEEFSLRGSIVDTVLACG